MHRRHMLLTSLGLAVAGQSRAEAKIGKVAPAWDVRTIAGNVVTSRSLAGKVVILNFWATWCAPCRAEMPALDQYYRSHSAKGLEVLAISHDAPADDAKVRGIASVLAFQVAYERDTNISGFGRIWQLPISFVIDRNGILRVDGSRKPVVFDASRLDQMVTPLL